MEWIRQILAVCFVFALLACMVWWLRGRSKVTLRLPKLSKRARRIEVLERLALTPQHSLHLVSLCGKQMVIAAHSSGVSVVERIEGPRPAAQPVPLPPTGELRQRAT
jgi:flagellar biogenesis protein FliO